MSSYPYEVIHQPQYGETRLSICHAHEVSEEDMKRLNPDSWSRDSGLFITDRIRITGRSVAPSKSAFDEVIRRVEEAGACPHCVVVNVP